MRKILIIINIIAIAGFLFAKTYYMDQKAGADYVGEYNKTLRNGTGTDTSYNSLREINLIIKPGDSCIIRHDTILVGNADGATEGIHPKDSGTAGNRITYKAYNGEWVLLKGNSAACIAINLYEGQDYITVQGLRFEKFYHNAMLGNPSCTRDCNYNVLAYDTFSMVYDSSIIDYRGSTISGNSDYNWVHHCLFEKYGSFWNGDENGNLFELGCAASVVSTADFNVVENCKFQYSAHNVIGVNGLKNTIRNNYFNAAPWYLYNDTLRGSRVSGMDGHPPYSQQCLFEKNRFDFGGENADGSHVSGEGLLNAERFHIIRHNEFSNNRLNGIYLHHHSSYSLNDNNCIYNNTFYKCGNNVGSGYDTPDNTWTHAMLVADMTNNDTTTVIDNHIKNNLFYLNKNGRGKIYSFLGSYFKTFQRFPDNQDIGTNWMDTVTGSGYNIYGGDPKFVDVSAAADPGNETNWNFSLQSTSGAIDLGSCLDSADNSGTDSDSLQVHVPYYFQNGWGNGAGGGASVKADIIALSTVSDTVQVDSVDYDKKFIRLATVKTWSDNAHIWLYKNSSGTVVLNGVAPDFGANEYQLEGNEACTTVINQIDSQFTLSATSFKGVPGDTETVTSQRAFGWHLASFSTKFGSTYKLPIAFASNGEDTIRFITQVEHDTIDLTYKKRYGEGK